MNDSTSPSTPSPRVAIADLSAGRRERSVFLVQQKRTDVTRAGDPYLSLTLGDKTGTAQGRVWEQAERYGALFEAGDYVFVDGFAETYRGEVQLRVQHLERVDASVVDESDFVVASAHDPDEMLVRLRALLGDVIATPDLRRLLEALLDDPELDAGLRRAPAAKVNHHAYLAGLLEHTLSLCELAALVGRHYERQYAGLLRTELLVAGALLHDLGKVWELSAGRTVEYTDVGNLVGHIVLGVERLTRVAASLGVEDEELLLRLKHMILSHHGEPEYGAVVAPKTPEAQVLHYLDQIDARLNIFSGALAGLDGGWSGWVSPLRRTLYAGPQVQAPATTTPGEPGAAAEAPTSAGVATAGPPPAPSRSLARPNVPRPRDVATPQPPWADCEDDMNASLLADSSSRGQSEDDDEAENDEPEPSAPVAQPPPAPRSRRAGSAVAEPTDDFSLTPPKPEPAEAATRTATAPLTPDADDDEGPPIDTFTLDLFGPGR